MRPMKPALRPTATGHTASFLDLALLAAILLLPLVMPG